MYEDKMLLLIMRHAKSDRDSTYQTDFERPLNDRGQKQPKDIAKKLNKLGITIDKALISAAKRTSETFKRLEKHLATPPKHSFEKRLYEAECETVLEVIAENAQHASCVLVVGHCPTVYEVTEYLCGEYHEFKTAHLAILSARTDDLIGCLKKPKQFRFEKMLTPDE